MNRISQRYGKTCECSQSIIQTLKCFKIIANRREIPMNRNMYVDATLYNLYGEF